MLKKRVTCLIDSSTFSKRMPLLQTLSQESIPFAENDPCSGYKSRRGSWMPCNPSFVMCGTADPRYKTRHRHIGVVIVSRCLCVTNQKIQSPQSIAFRQTLVHNNLVRTPLITIQIINMALLNTDVSA